MENVQPAAVEASKDIVQANIAKMEAQLKVWGAKVYELAAKAELAGTEAKLDYRKHVAELKAKHEAAQGKLAEVKAAGTEKWATLKTGIENAWSELDAALKKLTN